jgi:diguanylate cyclase (GGDEF)-like protein
LIPSTQGKLVTQYILFLVIAPFAIVIAVINSVLAWRVRRTAGAAYFAWFMIFITGFIVLNLFELLSTSQAGTLFWAKNSYLFITLIPVMWLGFILEYTGHDAWLLHRRSWVFLIIPILTNFIIQADQLSHLIWQDYTFTRVGPWEVMQVLNYGQWFWVHEIYSSGLFFFGVILLIFYYLRSRYINGKQLLLMILGVMLPVIVNMVYILKLIPQLTHNYVAVTFAVGGFIFFISVYCHKMLDLVPYARSALMERIRDGLIVLDHSQRIVDINHAALGMLTLDENTVMGKLASRVMPFWENLEKPTNGEEIVTEVKMAYSGGDHEFEARVIHLPPTLARPAGMLVMLHDVTYYKKLLERVVTMANIDPLTKINNRRYFYEQAQRELERVHRYHLTMSVVLVDMDSLKKINDTYGHIVGDNLLVAISNCLKTGAREVDTVARFGGDEFVLLLPLTGSTGAIQLMERLRHDIETVRVEGLPEKIPHTISIGIISLIGDTGLTFDEVLERADQAMYKSKLAGGNQITSVELESRR